ncbi:MAG TPA: hypothetical protein VF821_22170 [Lentzea sp.]
MRVYICQCLCGSNRHCIVSAVGQFDDPVEAEAFLMTKLAMAVGDLLSTQAISPWCSICGAKDDGWVYELGRTRWSTMEEAAPHLERSEAEQLLTNAVFGSHGPTPPRKQ